ncbi:MAG: MMPL family transporter [Candidatus Cloacimonetes bacterium]|nr:MMPL family transporter [Candidatus Cloacimonadota bacterium]
MTEKINSFVEKMARFIVKNPGKVLLVGLMLIAVMLPGLKHLDQDFGYRIWFKAGDPDIERFDAFERRFGNDDNIVVVMRSPSGIFDKSSAETLIKLSEEMWHLPDVIRVDSLSNYNWTHAEEDDLMVEPMLPDDMELTQELLDQRKHESLTDEVLPGYLVSKDGTIALMIATLRPALVKEINYEKVISKSRELLKKYEGKEDHTFGITGGAAVNDAFRESTQKDLSLILPMLIFAVVVILLFIFRNLSGVILPFMVIGFSLLSSLGFAGYMGVKLNNLTSFLPSILIGIGIADSIHILVTWYRYRQSGEDRRQAVYLTLLKDLKPTFLTSLSTSIGFFSLIGSPVVPTINLGLLAGVGSFIAWILTMTLLTPILLLVPIRVSNSKKKEEVLMVSDRTKNYVKFLKRKRPIVLGLFFVMLSTAAFFGLKNEVNSDTFEYFTDDVPLKIANVMIEKHVGWATTLDMVLDSGVKDGIKDPKFLKKAAELQDWIEAQKYVSSATSIVDIVKATNRSLNGDKQEHYKIVDSKEAIAQELFLYTMSLPQGMDLNNRMTLDQQMMRITITWILKTDTESLKAMSDFEAKAKELGLNGYMAGKYRLWKSLGFSVVYTFFQSIFGALILVSILMVLTLGSTKLGLLSLIPNVAPIIFGGGIMYFSGIFLDIGTALVASVCLGIAVDDTIHLLSGFDHYRKQGFSKEESMGKVLSQTGGALMITTLILVLGFGTYIFGSFVPNVHFGFMVALILSIALITDLTLLPALLLTKEDDEKQVD